MASTSRQSLCCSRSRWHCGSRSGNQILDSTSSRSLTSSRVATAAWHVRSPCSFCPRLKRCASWPTGGTVHRRTTRQQPRRSTWRELRSAKCGCTSPVDSTGCGWFRAQPTVHATTKRDSRSPSRRCGTASLVVGIRKRNGARSTSSQSRSHNPSPTPPTRASTSPVSMLPSGRWPQQCGLGSVCQNERTNYSQSFSTPTAALCSHTTGTWTTGGPVP